MTKKYRMNATTNSDKIRCSSGKRADQTSEVATGRLLNTSPNITVHGNICDLVEIEILRRKRYFLTMTTTPHQYLNVQLLRHRCEAAQLVFDFIVGVIGFKEQQLRYLCRQCKRAPLHEVQSEMTQPYTYHHLCWQFRFKQRGRTFGQSARW